MDLSTSRGPSRPLTLFAGHVSGRNRGIGALVAAALLLGCLAAATLGVRDAGAAFPGTNGPIACSGPLQEPSSAPNTSRLEIFTMNDSGSMDAAGNPTSQARLTTNFDSDFSPRYSADGRKIAFIRQSAAYPGGSVWTMDADGTNQLQLTFGLGGAAAGPGYSDTFIGGFSPDGTKIVFQRSVAPVPASGNDPATPRNFEIFTVNVDGTGLTNLTNNATAGSNNDSQPSWSPDGTRIAFQSTRRTVNGVGNADLWVMNADGTNPVNLTADSNAEEGGPEWSPDGSQLAFQSDRGFIPRPDAAGGSGRNLEIYRMNATPGASASATRLTFNDYNPAATGGLTTANLSGFDLFPHWSPEGDRIVFHSGRGIEFGAAQWDVFTINSVTGENPNGGQPARRLTRRDFNDERCGWGVLTHRLTVTKAGPGAGTVTSSVAGIACGEDCSDLFKADDRVTLTATPGGASPFLGFSGGGCSGTARTCTVTMSQAHTVTATFGAGVYTLPRNPSAGPGIAAAPFPGCPTLTANVIRGTAASNTINGTTGADRIFAGTGNDVVDALAGNDCVDLGTGDDRGQGGVGNDLMVAGTGNDRVSGSSGNDNMRGNPGKDRVDGGRGNDRLFGDSGNDALLGSFGNDRLHGVSGKDRISGSRGRDRINGGSNNDRISGGSSGDRIRGDAGSDRINGNSGGDRISGNSGNDRIISRDNSRDRVNCGRGRDRVVADRRDIVARNCERVRRR